MKKNKSLTWFAAVLLSMPLLVSAQDSTQEETPSRLSVIILNYYSVNNSIPYLSVETKSKTGKKFDIAAGVPVALYLGTEAKPDMLLAKVTTDKNGKASAGLAVGVADAWKAAAEQTITAVSEGTKNFDASETSVTIAKAKIELDTIGDGETRTVSVRLLKQTDQTWTPVPETELKIGIQRLGGNLPIGEDETYTTNEEGIIEAEFERVNVPGDEKGNIVLVAKVEENESLGNLIVEKTVPWGIISKVNDDFDARSLWATRDKAPVWLLFMAFSIMISVWTVIIYLLFQILKIRKLGLN